MTASLDLTVIFAFIIAFAVFAYVVMDGFDLGIGILFPAITVGHGRNRAMNAIAPLWDGNETWLVMGGGGLLAAFPLAYAVILPATYPLIIAMLLGLIFRGVAFEFRWRDERHRPFWDFAFFGGSLVAALSQGMVLGAILQGIRVAGRTYAGSWWDWLTPYTLLTGLGVVAGYALLGACWLIWKLEGEVQAHARRLAAWAGLATLVLMAGVSLANLALLPEYRHRWLDSPQVYFTSQVPLLIAIIAFALFYGLRKRWEVAPFLLALALFLLGMAGLGVTIWPYVVPGALTIWDTAAPARSQTFMLVGIA
ncbi:MAG: cytochrome d ubiquinol oxidase subunit II, partial [Tsuneonella sp.]